MTDLTKIMDDEAIKAIKNAATGGDMRKTFDSYKAAKAAFSKAAKLAKETGLALYEHSADSFAGMTACVGVVGNRERDANGKVSHGIEGLVLYPIPTLDGVTEGGDAARNWLRKLIEKEAAHVAYRPIRDNDSLEEFLAGAERMPTTVDAFVTDSRGGIDTDAVDTVWSAFRERLAQLSPKLVKRLPQKGEVIKSIRSKPYADEEYPDLESLGIFEKIGAGLIRACEGQVEAESGEPAPIDASAIKGWLDSRESTTIARRAVEAVELPDDIGSTLDAL